MIILKKWWQPRMAMSTCPLSNWLLCIIFSKLWIQVEIRKWKENNSIFVSYYLVVVFSALEKPLKSFSITIANCAVVGCWFLFSCLMSVEKCEPERCEIINCMLYTQKLYFYYYFVFIFLLFYKYCLTNCCQHVTHFYWICHGNF